MEFATCLNCMDGRVQLPVINWIRENYIVKFVDMITEPGIDGIISDKNNIETIIEKIKISLYKHNSNIIFLAGHYDCAGNPVDDKTHKENISKGVERLKQIFPTFSIIGLWVSKRWIVEKIIEL